MPVWALVPLSCCAAALLVLAGAMWEGIKPGGTLDLEVRLQAIEQRRNQPVAHTVAPGVRVIRAAVQRRPPARPAGLDRPSSRSAG